MHICLDCNHVVQPTIHARCPDCDSKAVAPLTSAERPYFDDIVIRETKRTAEWINNNRIVKQFLSA